MATLLVKHNHELTTCLFPVMSGHSIRKYYDIIHIRAFLGYSDVLIIRLSDKIKQQGQSAHLSVSREGVHTVSNHVSSHVPIKSSYKVNGGL